MKSRITICMYFYSMYRVFLADTTTEKTTTPATCPPCTGGGVLNRTDMGLGGRCGEHGVDGKCIAPNSACMQSSTDTRWKCRCAQAYGEKNSNCALIPRQLFSSQQTTLTIAQSTSTGSTVTAIPFSGLSGFSPLSHTASLYGQGSAIFDVDVNTNEATIKLNQQLDQYSYVIVLIASVTIENVEVRDLVEITISITQDSLIRKEVVIVDGTPEGSVVGQLCQSCFIGSDVIEIPNSNFIKINNDGNIVTSTAINLETIQNSHTIAYSTNILVNKNSNLFGNLTVVITRSQYTVLLSEDSTSTTQVGDLNIDHPFTVSTDDLGRNGQVITLGPTTLNYEGEAQLEKKLSLTISGETQHSMDISVTIKVLDVNDVGPRFVKTTYNFFTIPSAYINLVVGVVTAEDPDSDSMLTYSVAQNENLTIDNYGVLRIKQFITRPNYTLPVSVFDGKFTGSATVIIDLLQPTNTNLEKKYTWPLQENAIGSKNVYVADYKNFHFTDQLGHADFNLDTTSGIIQNRRPFDRENPQEREFKYTIVANKKNEAPCSLVIIGEITITITDVNDEPPVFVNTPYTATVMEESVGAALSMNPIVTTDKDVNSSVTYSLLSHTDKFNIDPSTGSIKTITKLDRETIQSIEVVVKAFDDINSATATVTVTIEDINDNDAENNSNCALIPRQLFSSQQTTLTIAQSTSTGSTVTAIPFSGLSGFSQLSHTASLYGQGSAIFDVDVNTNEATIKLNQQLDQYSYVIVLIASVTIDNVEVRDFVEITIFITQESLIRKDVVIVDGTPEGSVVGQLCQSCFIGSDVIEVPNSNFIKINNDGNIVTSTAINLETIQNSQTIAYSTNILVNKNSNLFGNLTVVITRSQYTVSLSEDSTSTTQLGDLNIDHPFTVSNDDLGRNGQTITLGPTILNYEGETQLEKKLSLTISGETQHSMDISVTIKVLDVNDVAPKFVKTTYNFLTIQSAYINLVVGVVTAVDPDSDSMLTYSVAQNKNLTIDNYGVLRIKQSITRPNYTLPVSVFDGKFTGSATIFIDLLQPTNTNLENKYIWPLQENTIGSKNVSVADYKNFHFTDQLAHADFNLDTTLGIIQNRRPFDRENPQEREFKYTIVANKKNEASCSLVITGEITITITDVNDEPPVFVNIPYTATVMEESVGAALSMNPIVTTDKDVTSSVTYSLLSHTNKFNIDHSTGSMKTITKLDRETIQSIEVVVKAFDDINSATTTVTVTIEDINDNDPSFSGSSDRFEVTENSPLGTVVGSVTATDADEGRNADINFDLLDNGGYFRINQTTGEIILSRDIDREVICTHTVTVYARDNGVNIRSALMTIRIDVKDINDNPPIFAENYITVDFEEGKACNNPITTIVATDSDKAGTANSQIKYSVISGSDHVKIDQTSGVLSCKSPFDYESVSSFTILIKAEDSPTTGKLSSNQTVIINVKDINDNSPQFVSAKPTVTIRYFAADRVVEVVSVSDADSGDNGRADLTLSGTASGFLTIDNNGILKTKGSTTPNDATYNLTFTATDNGTPAQSNTHFMSVVVSGAGTQPIRFSQQEIDMNIMENSGVNIEVESVAQKVNKPNGIVVEYEIIDEKDGLPFQVESDTGMVKVKSSIDRESEEMHEFVLRVKNTAATEQSDLAWIKVKLLDENDNPPIFERSEYFGSMREDATPNAQVHSLIKATDADTGENAKITFEITGSGGCIGKFALKDEVDDNTKSIVLSTYIDYEEYQSCKLCIKAYNQNKQTMSSLATVDVNILDYNDNPPEFQGHDNGVYTISIPEDTTINTEIPLIGELRDLDSRENGDLVLSYVNSDCLFDVSNYEKKIQLQLKSGSDIDYEKNIRETTCVVRASDKGTPSMSATATVSITITDVNDNIPHIINPDVYVNVSRDAANSEIVVSSIPATDLDSAENGQLVYSIKSSEYSLKFIIDPDTGTIKVNTPLSSVQKDKITIRAIVSDKGIPPLSSTATISINILDDNPRPYFEQPSPINIAEHSQLSGGEIVTIKAYDRVNGQITICDCTFRLDTDRTDLTIDNQTGVIRFKDIYDSFDRERESNDQVSVSVKAHDKDDPPKDSKPMVVMINILDINDQYPFFTQEIFIFSVFQEAANGATIGVVSAIDRDKNPETHYSINVTESGGFGPSVVSINQITGEITKTGNMKLNRTTNQQIKGWVYAQDSKDLLKQPDSSQVIITIEFDDKNKHPPLFHKDLYTPDLGWDADIDHPIVKVMATDNDTGVEGTITYSIKSGNNRGFFKIDDTGTLLLAYTLDSSIGSSPTEIVDVVVMASDGGIISKSSTTTVRIRISGSNPGSCIQGLVYQTALYLVKEERNNWSIALYVVVAVLCVAIICIFIFLYKWRASANPTVSEPFDKDHKLKYVSDQTDYSDLLRRQTVEYSHSNQGFEPPTDTYNTPTDVGEVNLEPRHDYPVHEWESAATGVLPTTVPPTFSSSS